MLIPLLSPPLLISTCSVVLHDTILMCCSVSLPWVDPKVSLRSMRPCVCHFSASIQNPLNPLFCFLQFCNSRATNTLSGGWVVDWIEGKCFQDCDPSNGLPCQVHNSPTATIFSTSDLCCNRLSWVDKRVCVANSLNTKSFSNLW